MLCKNAWVPVCCAPSNAPAERPNGIIRHRVGGIGGAEGKRMRSPNSNGWHAAVETELFVNRLDKLLLQGQEKRDPFLNRFGRILTRQAQVILKMPRLG